MQRDTPRRDPWPAVGIGCTIAFLVVAVLVARRGGLPFDAPFTAWLQGLPLPTGFWEACTFLGGVFLLPVGVAFVVAALLAGRPRLAVIVAVTLIAVSAVHRCSSRTTSLDRARQAGPCSRTGL